MDQKYKNKSYIYQFDKAVKIPLIIKQNSFTWPNITKGDTILLKLNVKQKLLKFTKKTFLKITANNYTNKHYIELPSRGDRYLNLSDMLHKIPANTNLKILSNNLTWHNQAELLIFNNHIPKDAKVLIIAPHADDAELAAFGFYSSHDTYVVTITAGEDGRNDYCKMYSKDPKEQYLFKAKLRTINSITVPLYGNVNPQKAINLGYFNGTLQDMYEKPHPITSKTTKLKNINTLRSINVSDFIPQMSGQATWQNLINDLTILINKIKPDIIVTPHPLLDKHSDHQFSTRAVFEALPRTDIKNGRFFFYVIHSILTERYPYGPMHSPVTLPPNFTDSFAKYSVYSQPLDHKQQIEKLFALNAMHDIAPIPGKRFNFSAPTNTYLRQHVRANEIFLVQAIHELPLHFSSSI